MSRDVATVLRALVAAVLALFIRGAMVGGVHGVEGDHALLPADVMATTLLTPEGVGGLG